MSDTLVMIVLLGGLTVGIWFSYRLFMRGDTDAERVQMKLPADFKPDWSYRCGDTYVGYEPARDRLVIVDYPRSAVMKAADLREAGIEDESVLGIVHRWIVVHAGEPATKLRIWFRLSTARRDAMLAKLKGLSAAG